MPSPFQKFGGNIGPDIDVKSGIQNAYAPISEGIVNIGKGIGTYLGESAKEKKEEDVNRAKAEADARKAEEERRRWSIEQERLAEKDRLDKLKFYMGQKEKETELRIKQAENRYNRLRDRLGDVDSQLLAYQSRGPDDPPLTPDEQAMIESLKKTKAMLLGEAESAGKAIEGAYGDQDANSSFNLRMDQYNQRKDREFSLASQTQGKPFDPVSGVRSGQQGVSFGGSMPANQVQVADNLWMYGTPSGLMNVPADTQGREVLAGEPPKFPMGGSADGYTESPGSEPSAGVGPGGAGGQRAIGLAGETPRSGLTGQPLELQPIGSNPLVTDIGSTWKNSNAYEDAQPDSRATGGRITFSQGPNGTPVFKLGVNPDATEKDKANLARMGSIVAFANTMTPSQALLLSGLIRGDRGKQATELYTSMKERGMIPPEMDLVTFKAATALSLYREGGSTAVGNLTPEMGKEIGSILSRNQDVTVQAPKAPVTPMSQPTPVVDYTPTTADWKPPFDINRTQRLMRAGANPANPKHKALLDVAKHLDQQGLAKARLQQQMLEAGAAAVQATVSESRAESESSRQTGMYESLLPGIGNSVGGDDVMFFNRTLGNDSKRDISLEWRQVRDRSGRLSAWNQIIGTYGFNEKLEQQRYDNAVEATTSMKRGFDGSMAITKIFEQQIGRNWVELSYDRITGGQAAVAAQYRLFLLGAFRKATVGLGNPSNFEQELLLNLVPDPTSPFQITSKSLAKARMLTLMTIANHMTDMEASKFVPSERTAEEYSIKLREAGIIGPKQSISIDTLRAFRGILRREANDPEGSIRALREWAQSTGDTTLTSVVTEATSDKFNAGNSAEAQRTRLNIDRFFVDTAHLDDRYVGQQPEPRRSGR